MKPQSITPKFPNFLHGGDYNPDQWLDRPDILAKDIELMKQANCNCMSLGIFAWATLEPREGEFNFEWLESVIDHLYANGIYTVLATPSGARPIWLAKKYPQVLRVQANRQRNIFGDRHNHCYTSPIYREKIRIINEKLSEKFAHHPGVIMWHISNEYGGDCHCEFCQNAFRKWLEEKYETIDNLNKSWWTAFWSHTYSDFDDIESPAPHGETSLHGLKLDWQRFVTHQTVDFMNHEIAAVKKVANDIPVTTNFMSYFGLDYFKFKDSLDLISWDSYPEWHWNDDYKTALFVAFWHNTMRSILQKPFALMESTPSLTNWQDISKLKKPGMHLLASLQAVANGSNTVQYFQWRKSRGSSEKFHGAVVDHYGEADTRVFKDVTEVGAYLNQMTDVYHSYNEAEVAIVYDWENRWAIEDSQGPRNLGKHYNETVVEHYKPFFEMGINVDVVDMACDINKYKLVVAPMLYMLRNGFEEKLREFVKNGGTVVMTYWSGIVDEFDLCFLGGVPAHLKDVFGIRSEEIDALLDDEHNGAQMLNDAPFGNGKTYKITELCDLIHLEGAKALATYTDDFYAGRPTLTQNTYGVGQAYYIAAKCDDDFNYDFYHYLAQTLNLNSVTSISYPKKVVVTRRQSSDKNYLFVQNYSKTEQTIELHETFVDVITSERICGTYLLKPYGVLVLEQS